MNNEEIIKNTADHVANTYGRFPIALVRGEGRRVWDADGVEYLDFVKDHDGGAIAQAVQGG